MAKNTVTPVALCTRTLADFVCNLSANTVPEAVFAHVKTLVADNIACTIGGSKTPLAKSLLSYATAMGGTATCPIPGTKLRTQPAMSAFVWATLANALDYDDTGSRGHPGASLIPAVISLALWRKAQGHAMSDLDVYMALVVGYEVCDRVSRATLPSLERYSVVHANGSIQAIGVAAACARLMNFDVEKTQSCMGLAGAMAPVPHAGKFGWEDPSICSVKDNVALPAENGVRAALLVEAGWEGTRSIMDGASSFGAMIGSDRNDENTLCDLSEFRLLNLALKSYPCCRWIHNALDALTHIMAEHAITAQQVAAVEVQTTPAVAAKFGKQQARTFLDMEFSLPLSLALSAHKIPHAVWYEQKYWDDSAITAWAANVTLHGNDALAEHFLRLGRDASRVPVEIIVRLHDGTIYQGFSDLAKGSAQLPLSVAEQDQKWRELITPVLGDEGFTALMQALDAVMPTSSHKEFVSLMDATTL